MKNTKGTKTAKTSTAKKANPAKKPQLNKKHVLIIVVSLCLAVVLATMATLYFTVWKKGGGTDINQVRYEVVPSSSILSSDGNTTKSVNSIAKNIAYAASSDTENDAVIKWSATDNKSNYYLLYLGYVKSTPVASNIAVWYNGNTPINVSFSKSTVTERSVQESLETCITESVTKSHQIAVSVTAGVEAEAGVVFTKVKSSLSASLGYTFTQENTTERSMTNTLTTARSNAEGLEEAVSFSIGENREPIGKYRLALFATVDMYLYVELSTDNSKIITSEGLVSARPSTYNYKIDYDPAEDGEFKKTSDSNLIDPSEEFFKQLTKPTDVVDTTDIPNIPVLVAGTYYESLTATCLKHDKDYNTNEIESGTRNNQADPNGLRIIITGCAKENGRYKKVDNNNIGISLEMLQGSGPQEWAVVGGNDKPKLNNDECTNVVGTSLKGTKVGFGAYQVIVYYTDGTNATKTAYNFMNGGFKGKTFDIFESFYLDSNRTVSRIHIVTVYEIWHGTNFYSDWRAENTIYFS